MESSNGSCSSNVTSADLIAQRNRVFGGKSLCSGSLRWCSQWGDSSQNYNKADVSLVARLEASAKTHFKKIAEREPITRPIRTAGLLCEMMVVWGWGPRLDDCHRGIRTVDSLGLVSKLTKRPISVHRPPCREHLSQSSKRYSLASRKYNRLLI